MIYYTAVPASGASCSGAATAGQPAHTHTPPHRHGIPPFTTRAPVALASPGTQVLADNLPAGRSEHGSGGGRETRAQCEGGGEGRYFP